jgi:protein SCO1/2
MGEAPRACYSGAMRHKNLSIAVLMFVTMLAACGRAERQSGMTDIAGVMPPLHFSMTRANDGAAVNARSYRGKVTILYFGYTNCPDICPTTLSNLSLALQRLGAAAGNVRVLFVTVDPARDTMPVLKSYVGAFAPQTEGLRGSPDALADLARRYRVAYSVTPASPSRAYAVMHSNAVFFFDAEGHARLVALSTDDIAALTADIEKLLRTRGS